MAAAASAGEKEREKTPHIMAFLGVLVRWSVRGARALAIDRKKQKKTGTYAAMPVLVVLGSPGRAADSSQTLHETDVSSSDSGDGWPIILRPGDGGGRRGPSSPNRSSGPHLNLWDFLFDICESTFSFSAPVRDRPGGEGGEGGGGSRERTRVRRL
jgi:hypothetical protein